MKKFLVTMLVVLLSLSLLTGWFLKKRKKNKDTWKIGIVTGTVAQNEEEYRAAQTMLKKYGADHIVVQTYPDRFMDEQETVIANIAGLASDPDLKALIIVQGVPGTSAAIDKVKEMRDDLLIIVGTPGEDPPMIAARADLIFMPDELGMGSAIIEQAKKLGAKTFVHYSFPRHMSYALLAARRELFKENCAKLGLDFVDATAPDPTADGGVSATQQFILEDIPRMVAKYGKDTAFFGTNCAMQPAMIKAIVSTKAIYPQPCCPSPTHGFPSALEVDIPEEKAGNFPFIIDQITEKVAEAGMSGRLSTWPVPVNMMFIEVGAEYAINWIKEGHDKLDEAKLQQAYDNYLTDFGGGSVSITPLDENGQKIDHFKMILSGFLDF
ncbi:MAG: DUF3798 domain-containing protein [Spirochaetes bacterium]|nr:DUF3798 domain-containing protein [Spirochaetota bacterium]